MSHSAHHGSHRDASNPEACGSRVRASRDHQAETSGQAATTTHTLDRHHATYPPGRGQTWIGPSDLRPASVPGTLLTCPTGSPSPADVATSGRPDDTLARHGAATPLTAAPSGGAPPPGQQVQPLWRGPAAHTVGTALATAFGTTTGQSTRTPPVSVAVKQPSPPDPRSHHDGLSEQRFITRNRCR